MATLKYFLAACLAVVSLGCPTRSLFPLFAEKDLASIPAIIGTWGDAKGEAFTFQSAGDNGYDVVSRDKDGVTALYKVQLRKLGKSWFLDSYPGGKGNDHHLIRAHIISRIWVDGDSLRVASLESDWLRQMIDSGKLTIAHVKLNNDIILTASTEELQSLVLRYADDEQAFPKSPALARMKR